MVEGEESPFKSKFSKVKSIQGFERKVLKESPAPATLYKPRSIKDFIQENEEKMRRERDAEKKPAEFYSIFVIDNNKGKRKGAGDVKNAT